jgi:hypothetical protein
MKTTKNYTASEIVTYRISNTTRRVEFDTLKEAVEHVVKEQDLHPRSKKFNPFIRITETGKSIHFIDAMKSLQNS